MIDRLEQTRQSTSALAPACAGTPAGTRSARVPLLTGARALLAASIVAGLLCSGPARSAADDASNWVVIPWVVSGPTSTTQVTVVNPVSNLISTPEVTFVAADPGLVSPPVPLRCAAPTVLPLSSTSFDLRTACGLGTAPVDGALHIRTQHRQGSVERISATAVVEDRSPLFTHDIEQRVAVEGIPMAGFPGNDQEQVVDGLEADLAGATRTDCHVVTGLDGSRAGGAWVALRLRDEQNAQIGSDVLFPVRPFAVGKVEDVFRRAGVSGSTLTGVRARFGFAGGGDHALAYCTMQRRRGLGQAPGASYHVALPLDPTGPTRSRSVTAASDLANPNFTVTGPESAAHALFVRHPDRLSCNATSTDSEFASALLKVALRNADLTWVVDNGTPATGTVDVALKSTVDSGTSGIWMLHVEQVTPDPSVTIPYTVNCVSGNGTSAPDYRFVFKARPN